LGRTVDSKASADDAYASLCRRGAGLEYSRKIRPRMPYRTEPIYHMDTPSREVFRFLMEKRKEHCVEKRNKRDRLFDAKYYTERL
jgi:hypothetical protein